VHRNEETILPKVGPPSFLLFVSGEPFDQAMPGSRYRVVSAAMGPGPLGSASWGGHEPADFQGDQLYGQDARVGRMVLEIAQQRGIPVKVIDINHPGPDSDLVRRYITGEDVFPVLVRPDGARLAGEESFVPGVIERFLRGPS